MGFRDWFSRRRPDASQVTEAAFLARVEAAIETTRVPFARIEVADADEPLAPTASKIGGVPYLPQGVEPPGEEPFAFLAQINFADLALEPFPRHGLVQFWVADDDVYGAFRAGPRSGFRCLYYPTLDRPQRAEVPTITALGPLSEDRRQLGRGLRFCNDTGVVSPGDYHWEPFLARIELTGQPVPQAAYTRYSALGHRIGGYCDFTQSDPRRLDDPKLSLLQLDSDEHIFWGDTGLGHWFIGEADLRAGEFSRVEYHWDCC
ncbi:MAG: DUF1963 domain-containing protein [Kofleriaceae bacterium]